MVLSATIQLSKIPVLKDKMSMHKRFKFFHRSNDRPNVFYAVQAMKYPRKSFEDLAFLIPRVWKEGDPLPPKFLVFFDNKKEAELAACFLHERVPLKLRDKLAWVHAGMTSFF